MSAIFFVLALTAASSGGVRLSYFNVEETSPSFVITWLSEEETDVREYALQRRTIHTNGVFVPLQTLPVHGTGKEYRYEDDQVFKSEAEQVDYRLEAVFTNGLRQVLVSRSIHYTPTAVRRTWGSIKAMFQ